MSIRAERVRDHLCGKGLFGDLTELCEMRGDCVWVVTCPDCGASFSLDEEDLEALVAWSHASGQSCGVTLTRI